MKAAIDKCIQGSGLETCRLCEIMRMYSYPHRQRLRSGRSSRKPMKWRLFRESVRQKYGWGSRQICGVWFDGSGFHWSIWADEGDQKHNPIVATLLTRILGSPASATLVDRSPILGPHMNKVCDLVQRWRNECDTHENCMPEDDNPMPSRVLAICGDDARPPVQLIETKGQQGRYLALSHCWGSNEKRPLRTTSENYHIHQIGIPFGDLPKTFQDTVKFAQGIGIRYVWIDSLCIIQGNSQDWHSEAANMGDVYRNAALVVAASGAKDSSEGLFIDNRPLSTVLRLPYRMGGECKGTFNMIRLPGIERRHPKHGPLEKRAWTLQERYLVPRFIAFMPRSISWICNGAKVTETGEGVRGFDRYNEWTSLLREYTLRSLSFASDRLEAIRGIATFNQFRRKDRYVPEYGVWEEDLAYQLLWLNDGSNFDNSRLANIPSWSWAAIGGAKEWVDKRVSKKRKFGDEEMSHRLVMTSAGHLQISGHLSTIQPAPKYQRDVLIVQKFALHISASYSFPWKTFLTQDMDGSGTDNTLDKAVLGLAQFDDRTRTTYTHACFLKKTRPALHVRGPPIKVTVVRSHRVTIAR